jgi:hypothetical protein
VQPWKPKRVQANSEADHQNQLVRELKARDWFVKVIVGNATQFGLPDIFAAHVHFGQKWIEMKKREKYSFTAAQQIEFPKLHAAGVGIWILFDSTEEEIAKLSRPANWWAIYFEWYSRGHSANR